LAYSKRLAPYDLTPPQFFVFHALCRGGSMSLGELSEQVCMDPSTLTGIVDRLEKKNYVQRKQNPGDRRSTLVDLTDKGRVIAPKIVKFAGEIDDRLRQHFSIDEMQHFEKILNSLAECPEYWE
jgi:DNA-binding MarR family transcriptional regulator